MFFTISELVIDGEEVPLVVADKLLRYHIVPMNKVRAALGVPVHCKTSEGLNSGFRPHYWEILQERQGTSQHTFGDRGDGTYDETNWGAIDWRSEDLDLLQQKIIELTDYSRIARYGSFIHCDYKAKDGKRYLFNSAWELQEVF